MGRRVVRLHSLCNPLSGLIPPRLEASPIPTQSLGLPSKVTISHLCRGQVWKELGGEHVRSGESPAESWDLQPSPGTLGPGVPPTPEQLLLARVPSIPMSLST